ncbi:MAG TPA: hypothetical protein PLT37_06685 [Kiritimatiellia bacterium]|jgi:hypothetical protein|nr:hypothetical protein [Kiritimatiellia bacterium]
MELPFLQRIRLKFDYDFCVCFRRVQPWERRRQSRKKVEVLFCQGLGCGVSSRDQK